MKPSSLGRENLLSGPPLIPSILALGVLVLSIVYGVGGLLGPAQGLLSTLHSGITFGMVQRTIWGGMRIEFESGIHKCLTQCIITADLILKVMLYLLCLQHQRIFCTHDETAYKLDIVMSHTTQNLIAQATIILITPCLHLLRLLRTEYQTWGRMSRGTYNSTHFTSAMFYFINPNNLQDHGTG